MSYINVIKRKKIIVDGQKVELRIKGDWYWAHIYLPIFAFISNIFKKGYKKRFMEEYITVSKTIKPVIYVTTKNKRIDRESLEHEIIHLKQMGNFLKQLVYSFNYILRPKKRFFYELEAYEVQFKSLLQESGKISIFDRIRYAKIMSGDMYYKPVSFEFALEEIHKVCDRLEKNVSV